MAPSPPPPPLASVARCVRTLAHLKPGECARVRRVTGSGAIYRRILDMGISRGTLVELEREAPLRDPLKIKVRGYALSLRRCEARLIELADAPAEQASAA